MGWRMYDLCGVGETVRGVHCSGEWMNWWLGHVTSEYMRTGLRERV